MLSLTRRIGERIIIGEEGKEIKIDGPMTITLISVRGNQAKLGLEFSRDIPIAREELIKRTIETNGV